MKTMEHPDMTIMDESLQAGNHQDQPGVDLQEMTMPDGDNNTNHPDCSNRANLRIFLLVVALLVGVAACLYYYVWVIAPFETTDNAYVQGNITTVAAKVPGYVADVCVDDNDTVNAGDVLFRIEDADYRARVAQAEAHVRAQRAALHNIDASVHLQRALIEQAEAQYLATLAAQERATNEHTRQKTLLEKSATTGQIFEDAVSATLQADAMVAGAKATVATQQRKLDVFAAEREGVEALLAQAQASLALAELELGYTVVHAPVAGVVGNRKVRLGRYATPGAALLDVVPVGQVWVVANFKETQIHKFQCEQQVTVTIDGYPDVIIQGVVDSVAPGSGAAFSLLPPDNATGNFIRVVQRVPVKIRLVDNPLVGRLVPGLSARVSVRRGMTNL